MKKILALVLATLMLLGMVSTAFAVEASYQDGKVTVTTGDSGFFEICRLLPYYVAEKIVSLYPQNIGCVGSYRFKQLLQIIIKLERILRAF